MTYIIAAFALGLGWFLRGMSDARQRENIIVRKHRSPFVGRI